MDSHETPARDDQITASVPPAQTPAAAPPPDAPAEPATLGDWFRQNGSTLLIVAIGLILMYRWLGPDGMWTAFLVAVGLGTVIFIHELGHFLVAKWCDVHVDTFSIGFGPPLPGCKFKWGETTYMIAVFPLGGYVKMVGENPESDEDENDPRSFKNKKVWQRMAIISAGVFMNIVLGAVCFIVAYLHGIDEPPGVIGNVDAGAPAWVEGSKSGDIIYVIGDVSDPTFEQLVPEVALSDEKALPFAFGEPGQQRTVTTVEPKKIGDGLRPRIGFSPPESLRLVTVRLQKHLGKPVADNSAAAKAEPAFAFDDLIVGMSDPKQGGKVTPLGNDPRYPKNPTPDYFEFYRRMKDLAGQDVKVLVRRGKEGEAPTETEISVPPAHHWKLGLRMKMGNVIAVRKRSDAEAKGIQARNKKEEYDGDVITKVEVVQKDGKRLQWVAAKSTSPLPADVEERELDPLRLPYELQQWAHEVPGPKKVRITVIGKVGSAKREKEPVDLVWDDGYRYDQELPLSSAAMGLGELGIAYQVKTAVDGVAADSPAAKAKVMGTEDAFEFKKGDVITHVCPILKDKETGAVKPATKRSWIFWTVPAWREIKPDEWATQFYSLQRTEAPKEMLVRVERDNDKFEVHLKAEPDATWYMTDRGFRFMNQTQLHQAKDLGEAISLGFNKALYYVKQIYRQLSALITGKLSIKNMSGPIGIATTAYAAADTDIWILILFLGIISVNLAVVNFLPIPVLDGGHMVFLIYEWLRGKPASQAIYAAANYVGLFAIASLMLFVIYLDISRHL